MKLQITAQSYHLRYLPEEDRILLSVSVKAEREFGVMLTRRLIHVLLKALAKIVAERGKAAACVNPVLRDTILDFEHSRAVANAVAKGNMRDEKRDVALSAPPKLIRKVSIVPKDGGAFALVFDHPEQVLTLRIGAERLHTVIETFVRMAERVGWDFPPLAGWLDASKQEAGTTGRSLN